MRTTVRHLCSELVSIARLNSYCLRPISGNLEEIGESSAVVLVEDAIPLGTKIRIACETSELIGVVRAWTLDRSLGFFVEVGLDPASSWSAKWFAPKHLLAFCGLKTPKKLYLRAASGY
jgi:hypothetical protein